MRYATKGFRATSLTQLATLLGLRMNDVAQMAGDALVLVDRRTENLPPGHRLRVESIVECLREMGYNTSLTSLTRGTSALARVISSLWRPIPRGARMSAGNRVVVVAGFGAPHMLILANRVAKGQTVIFDTCDSWELQARARSGSAGVSTLPPRVGRWLQPRCRRIALVTYICARDAAVDSRRDDPSRIRVLPQARNRDLESLPEVSFPLTRLVIAADMRSFHNQAFIRDMGPALGLAVQLGELPPIEVYGHQSTAAPLPEGLQFRGWADSLSDVYAGDTGVIVTNAVGSGVPNKYLEAIAARRPVLAQADVEHARGRDQDMVYVWRQPQELIPMLKRMVAGVPSPRMGPEPEMWPEIEARDLV